MDDVDDHRRDDPLPAVKAAGRIAAHKPSIKNRIVQLLTERGIAMANPEISRAIGVPLSSVTPRMPELERDGKVIRDGEMDARNVSNNKTEHIAWRIAPPSAQIIPLSAHKKPAPAPPVAPAPEYNTAMSNEPLITRHRPASFSAVYGNAETVATLEKRINDADTRPHAYLFTGPSGVGKTTLARIIGRTLGSEVIEIDAAANNGVEAMRGLIELAQFIPMDAATRLFILDEGHMLSRAAWNTLLKLLEEPPAHQYLAICTTELSKVPDTVLTRCYHVKLDHLPDKVMIDFLGDIVIAEEWGVIKDDVFDLVVHEALGSPRHALTLLQAVYDARDLAEAKRIVTLRGSASPLIQVMRVLVSRKGGWEAVRPLLAQLSDDDFSEQSLVLASRYILGAMNREEDEKRANRLWELLACFLYPVNSYDPRSVFYAAVGRILWSAA